MNAKLVDLNAIIAQYAAAKSAAAAPAPAVRPAAPPAPPAPSAADAKAFMLALRSAGKRPNEAGVLVTAGRDEQIADERALIGSFCGYSAREAHGAQLDRARSLAAKAMRPVAPSATPYSRGTSATVTGYVAGLNDSAAAMAKQNGAIEGQIRAALDEASDALSREDFATLDRIEREINVLRSKLVG